LSNVFRLTPLALADGQSDSTQLWNLSAAGAAPGNRSAQTRAKPALQINVLGFGAIRMSEI
jgi:hypothetical protein